MPDQAAIGYIRVSTEDQQLGPEAQRAQLIQYAEANGLTLAATFDDLGISGAAPVDDRPGLLQAIEAVKANQATILLVAKRDRLARDVVIAAVAERLLSKLGARIVSADGTANGDGPEASLMRSILDAFAQYERALIRARIKAALAVKKDRGERTGSIPFGYDLGPDGKTLRLNDKEQQAIKRMRTMRNNGKSLRQIAVYLTRHGYAPRGGRWHPTTVMRVLRRVA